MSLLLFDIDGTLLLSGGAGIRAMTRAFRDLFGVAAAFAASDVAGRTDTFILSAALRQAGLPDTPAQHRRFREVYFDRLRDEIARPPTGRWGLMPGVDRLLETLGARTAVHLALLTGNFEQAARIKLEAFGIGGYFAWGAFGDESHERDQLARIAVARAEERGLPPHVRERPLVIGDTPHDITCARAIGARVIAVATGSYSPEQLADADLVLPDLSNTASVITILEQQP